MPEWEDVIPDETALEDNDALRPLRDLKPSPKTGDLEIALRAFRENIVGEDSTRRVLLRNLAIGILKDKDAECPAKTIDESLKGLNSKSNDTGKTIDFDTVDPWPDPVSCGELLDNLVALFRTYIVLPKGAAVAQALWVLHTYVYDCFDTTPRLCVQSPTKRCGKTKDLEILCATVSRALPAVNVTPAAVFRSVEKFRPTLLVDEGDTFLREKDELRGVLNSGHTRATAFTLRTVGEDNDPRLFSTWTPVAFALIGRLPDTLEDRSIVVSMKRKTASEKVQRVKYSQLQALTLPLRQMATRWAKDNEEVLRGADPETPEKLDDRAQDNWRPLLAIADLAGGTWPEKARAAALKLSLGRDETENSWGVQALADIRDLFEKRQADRLETRVILSDFEQMEDRPWPEYGRNGKPITARQLSNLLRPFDIKPKTIRLLGDLTPKGYVKEDFEEAFKRYIPPSDPQQPPH